MAKFLTSDLHFGHTNIIAYTKRPYDSVDQMNEDLVRRFNSVVQPEDEVWILGDLAMGHLDDSLQYVAQLNGLIYLVPGNHDRMFEAQGTKYANWVERYLNAGITKVLDYEVILQMAGLIVTANHFPRISEKGFNGHEDQYAKHRPTKLSGHLVHGHTHGLWRKMNGQIDVGVDAWGGRPVSFEKVAELFLADNSLENEEVIPWT